MLRLQKLLIDIIPKEHRWKVKLFQEWDSIIGDLKGKVRIEKIDKSMLVLGVCHPVWAQELHCFSDLLKARINSVLKNGEIKTIRFQTVSLHVRKSGCGDRVGKISFEPNEIVFHKGLPANKEVVARLKCVRNQELRGALEAYYHRCMLKKDRIA